MVAKSFVVIQSLSSVSFTPSLLIQKVHLLIFDICADHAAMVLKFGSDPDEIFFIEATSN